MDHTSSSLGAHTMASESWHLSKTIPVTIIFSILVQTIVFVVFLTTLSGDVAQNTKDIQTNTNNVDLLGRTVQSQEVTLGRIDENIKAIKEFLENANSN
jgi:amino acid transporter